MSENELNESSRSQVAPFSKIDAVTAKRFFFNYHQNAGNPHPGIANSLGKLKVKDSGQLKPIQHLVVPAEIFRNLEAAVNQANFIFIGIAALPATNDDGSDTLLLVAIAENSQSQQFYFLPPNTSNVNYIYDHIRTCPAHCSQITNHQKVWDNWTQ